MPTTPETAHEVITQVNDLLTDNTRWIKGQFAADRSGTLVNPEDPTACAWCLVGAIKRVTPPTPLGRLLEDQAYDLLLDHIVNSIDLRYKQPSFIEPVNSLTAYNDEDSTTFDEVKDILTAIAQEPDPDDR